ncbi:MAG: universal stress protein [Actinobacteria bacterium]|nr:universal stress protein [Actinomycetota bacterium]MBV8396294.1 universal stress protein [Actinomycetota bacterium]MBV8597953.1 universal stress protein [Actinomycetota bacterium]
MATKIIVSYDGTDNDQDALALARVLGRVGGSLELAYVRHSREEDTQREVQVQKDAHEMLARGAEWLGDPEVPQHVIFSASTPEGLESLADSKQADVIVFGSEYRTTPRHVFPQASALRLFDGGRHAVAIAPAGLRSQGEYAVEKVAAIDGDLDPSATETAGLIAQRLGATLAARANGDQSLLVVGSKLGTKVGRVTVSAAAQYAIELVRCPVLVIPRETPIRFGS